MKKRWFRRLLERRILVILLLLGQLVFLIGLIQSSSQTYRVINWILTAVSIGVALYIISKKDKGATASAVTPLSTTQALYRYARKKCKKKFCFFHVHTPLKP